MALLEFICSKRTLIFRQNFLIVFSRLHLVANYSVKLNNKINDSDNSLITLLQKGDMNAFRLLFEKYSTRLYLFSKKYLRDKEDAEDLINEVFLKIWENRISLKTNTSFKAYLFTIAYNNIRQKFLKKGREEKYVKLFAKEYLDENSLDEEQLDYMLFVKQVNQLIESLPERRKEIFCLSYKEELKNREIADRLNLSEQFVKNQLSVARKYIIDKMKDDKHLAGILLLYLFYGVNDAVLK
jgi:RNA polymerase sigma-70 factor (ECF subfamily)